MAHSTHTIGSLADLTSCNIPTIRYYEQIGLLPPAQRAANGHRYYVDADLARLSFIKRCRDFGFAIEQVRQLLPLFDDLDRPCVEARDLAQIHLQQVRDKLEQMRQLEATLAAFVTRCDATCVGGDTRNCCIIENLSSLDVTLPSQDAGCCKPAKKF
ncbi:MAG: helix-turn-helix domain-containing protein [Pseudomonadota bacterium]